MRDITRILFEVFVIVVVAATSVYVYRVYGDEIQTALFGEEDAVVYLGNLAVRVTVADDPDERQRGLSNTESLRELEGKLFIFDTAGMYHIWMKDMQFPIDILFINEKFVITDIHSNVSPNTYPETFTSSEPSRFVLETNALFAQTFNVSVGDRVLLPAQYIPNDLRENLQ